MAQSMMPVVELGEFQDFCKQNSTLLFSVNRLHEKLLKMTLGPARWDVLSTRRLKASNGDPFLSTEKILRLHEIDAWTLAGNPAASKDKAKAKARNVPARAGELAGMGAGAGAGPPAAGKGRRGSTGSISATGALGRKALEPKQSFSQQPVAAAVTSKPGAGGAGAGDSSNKKKAPLEPKQSFSLQPVAASVVSKPEATQQQRKPKGVEKVAPLRRSISASQLLSVEAAAKKAAAAAAAAR